METNEVATKEVIRASGSPPVGGKERRKRGELPVCRKKSAGELG
jgi:hypothetical protein